LICKIVEAPLLNTKWTDKKAMAFLNNRKAGGASVKQMIHLTQLIDQARFNMFDYGRRGNLRVYGRRTSPNYNLQAISGTVPIGLFVGKHDELATVTDANWLAT